MNKRGRVYLTLVLGLALSCALPLKVFAGETIRYNGDQADLQADPLENGKQSLFPASGGSKSDNTIEVNIAAGGNNIYRVYGGIETVSTAGVFDNKVSLMAGSVINDVYGGNAKLGAAYGNEVTIKGNVTIGGYVYAGYSGGDAYNNTVNISGNATIAKDVQGGSSDNGNVWNNTVNIAGHAHLSKDVYGASSNGEVSKNTVILKENAVVDNIVVGGLVGAGKAFANQVDISGDAKANLVYGGFSLSEGSVTGNTVNISGNAQVATGVQGGFCNAGDVQDDVSGNVVSISGNAQTGYVYGGAANQGKAENNIVTLSDDVVIKGKVTAGDSVGDANGNQVLVNGGTVTGDIKGGDSRSGGTSRNIVSIGGGVIKGDITAGYGSRSSDGNIVKITGGEITGNVTGGSSNANSNNTITISGGTVSGVVRSGSGSNSSGNTINITNNARVGVVYGGSDGKNAIAENNTINISDQVMINGDVVAGGKNTSNNNVVNITGGTIKGAIFGGTGVTNSNNTLNWGTKSTLVAVGGFQNYNFTIPNGVQPDEVLLTITGGAATNLEDAKIKLVAVQGNRQWENGEQVTLINNASGITGNYESINGSTASGLRLYEYTLANDSNNITATIVKAVKGSHSKNLSEARVAGMSFVNMAGDLVASSGLQNVLDSSSNRYDMFGAMNYGDNKLTTGANNNIKGSSMLLGFGRKFETKTGNWTVGAFLESGNSSYDTNDNFDDIAVYAHGKNNYFGGGLMARNVLDNGLYVEGSARIGRMSTDYNSYDIASKYDIKSTYYGLHLGVGKVWKTSNKTEIDIYGKYFWSHQNSASAVIKGDTINFDSLDSNRLRIGARMNFEGGGHGIKTYIGIAYEHEFSGSARGTALGESIAAPSIKGGTGIGEVGATYKPSGKSAFSIDIGLSGYVGKRQGIGGRVNLNWGF